MKEEVTMIENQVIRNNDKPMTRLQQQDFDAYYNAPNAREIEMMRQLRRALAEREAKQNASSKSA